MSPYQTYQDAARSGLWQTWQGGLSPVVTPPGGGGSGGGSGGGNPPPPPPPPPPPGALALAGAAVGSVPATDPAIAAWESAMGRTLEVRHYFAQGSIPASYAASDFKGEAGVRKILLDFELAKDGSQASALDKFLGSCADAGLAMDLTLWHNPQPKLATPAAFFAALAPYVPLIKKHGHRFIFDVGGYRMKKGDVLTWWPGDHVAVDAIGIEYYAFGWVPPDSEVLDPAAAVADSKGVQLMLTECGAEWAGAGGTDVQTTTADGLSFFAAVHTFFQKRIAAGKPQGDIVFWNTASSASGSTPGYVAGNQPASWITAQQGLYDMITAAPAA